MRQTPYLFDEQTLRVPNALVKKSIGALDGDVKVTFVDENRLMRANDRNAQYLARLGI